MNESCPVIEVTVDASMNPIRIKTVKVDPTVQEVKK